AREVRLRVQRPQDRVLRDPLVEALDQRLEEGHPADRLVELELPHRPSVGEVAPARPFVVSLGERRAAEERSMTTSHTAAPEAGAYADVNGLHLYYEIHGKPIDAAVPLIALHGGLGSGEMLAPLLPTLSIGRQV